MSIETIPSQNLDQQSDDAREQESEAREKLISGQSNIKEYLSELNKICLVGELAENKTKDSLISIENAFVHYKDAYVRLMEVAKIMADELIDKKLQELKIKLENLIAKSRKSGDNNLADKLQSRFDRITK